MQQFESQLHQSKQYQEQDLDETSVGSQFENPQQQEQQFYYQHGYQAGYTAGFYTYANAFRISEPNGLSRLGGAIAYLGGWFTGLLLLLFAWPDRYVRFHALQSLAFFGGANVLLIIGVILSRADAWFLVSPHAMVALVFILLFAIVAIGWVVGIIGALGGQYIQLPLVGNIAAQGSGHGMPQGTVK